MDSWLIITGILISGPTLVLIGAYLLFKHSIPIRKMLGKVFLISGIIWIMFLLIIVGMGGWFF